MDFKCLAALSAFTFVCCMHASCSCGQKALGIGSEVQYGPGGFGRTPHAHDH